jgi:phage portal protein BeeE
MVAKWMSFYERLLLSLRERQDAYAKVIVAGKLNSEEYKEMAGKFQGLREAEEEVKSLYVRMYENAMDKE